MVTTLELGVGTSAWGRLGSVNGLAIWGNSNADTDNSPHFYINTNGDIGVGTSTQQAKLDVSGNIALNGNQLRLQGGGDGNHYLQYLGGSFDGPKLNGNRSVVISTNTDSKVFEFLARVLGEHSSLLMQTMI